MAQQNDTGLGNKPIIVILGLIASLISIFVFLTGKDSLPTILNDLPATPTDLPNISPTNTLIAQPTIVPNLDKLSVNLLPSSNEISDSLNLAESDLDSTNEEVAKQYDNPTEKFNQLEKWGRINGYYQNYLHDNGCNSTTGLRQVTINIVLYKADTGSSQALEWFISQGSLLTNPSQPESISAIGDKAFVIWANSKDDCTPSNDLDHIEILFTRYNVFGSVAIETVAKTTEKDDMLALAIRIAQLIDLRIVAASK